MAAYTYRVRVETTQLFRLLMLASPLLAMLPGWERTVLWAVDRFPRLFWRQMEDAP